MRQTLEQELAYAILEVVNEIPKGKVATYGQIAKLIGRDKNSRLVGRVLAHAEMYGEYPCFRVVNSTGRVAPHFEEQVSLLIKDGVVMKDARHVDLKKSLWKNF